MFNKAVIEAKARRDKAYTEYEEGARKDTKKWAVYEKACVEHEEALALWGDQQLALVEYKKALREASTKYWNSLRRAKGVAADRAFTRYRNAVDIARLEYSILQEDGHAQETME
tara:strand:- start:1647 stop:1988 length:342 start_codon:yes stop_codon:yes gene_type:complete